VNTVPENVPKNPRSHYRGSPNLQVRIDKDLQAVLLQIAADECRSVASLVNLVLREFVLPSKPQPK
jgi:hypothetical protein